MHSELNFVPRVLAATRRNSLRVSVSVRLKSSGASGSSVKSTVSR